MTGDAGCAQQAGPLGSQIQPGRHDQASLGARGDPLEQQDPEQRQTPNQADWAMGISLLNTESLKKMLEYRVMWCTRAFDEASNGGGNNALLQQTFHYISAVLNT